MLIEIILLCLIVTILLLQLFTDWLPPCRDLRSMRRYLVHELRLNGLNNFTFREVPSSCKDIAYAEYIYQDLRLVIFNREGYPEIAVFDKRKVIPILLTFIAPQAIRDYKYIKQFIVDDLKDRGVI